tara:strand:- start:2067 stop:2657 length:591 start_codon:yes stop_codon:yes gene_type:complete
MEQLKMRYETYLLKHKAKQNRGAKYSRDTEKLKTYKSEWSFQSRAEIPDFKDLKEAQNFANKLYKSKTWIKLWKKSVEEDVGKIFSGQPQVVGMSRRSKTMSGYTNGTTVTLCPTTGMNKYVLLHELAHCLGHMHHGRSFRQCVLSLVGAFMGAKEKKILKEEFKKKKLACGEPRKPMSYENWVASVRRMEKVRGE